MLWHQAVDIVVITGLPQHPRAVPEGRRGSPRQGGALSTGTARWRRLTLVPVAATALVAGAALPAGATQIGARKAPQAVADPASLVNPFTGTKDGCTDFGHG